MGIDGGQIFKALNPHFRLLFSPGANSTTTSQLVASKINRFLQTFSVGAWVLEDVESIFYTSLIYMIEKSKTSILGFLFK